MDYHTFFTARISPGERVLDLGCGNGALSHDLAMAGALVTGMDHNPESISLAKSRYSHPGLFFLTGDALTTDYNQPFDVVVLSNILEHLEGRVAFLQKVVLQTSAKRLLIRVPMFKRDWRVPLRQELGLEWRLDPTHQVEYTEETLKTELENAGLNITHWQCCWGEFWLETVSQGSSHGG
ncbi:MAG: class I SAM-dependent methyltransferase [Magnetococcales bacterium]|nr:class I SAM-dependent methyltransferase [Magnetococcales bacterium]NGZ28307.1 class I SAM-dependent methyltransferase [Magnetococcales bacterium]